jgi:hypothetical protein
MARSYSGGIKVGGLLLAQAVVCWGCGSGPTDSAGEEGPSDGASPSALAPAEAGAARLYLSEAGLVDHRSGATGEFYFPEIAGAGGALFDYDGDGDLDLYVVQGGSVEAAYRNGGVQPDDDGDRLYRTEYSKSPEGRRQISFEDVTERAGIRATGYGMGVTVGDVDNDGWPDLYVTNAGPNQLWRNNRDGTFSEVTQEAGVEDDRWSTSASFFDYDNDGWLDLYVSNYVDFRLETHRDCRATSGALDYCGPLSYNPEPDRLLRNLGDGRFTDVTEAAGLGSHAGSGLGVTAADFDNDGWQDLFVANDQMVNYLWMNQGDGTFSEEAALAGCAVNMEGNEEASMGVVAADFNDDGALDLFMTHLDGETNTLYLNDGNGLFSDRTAALGLAAASMPSTGFGTEALDFDLDGWQDIFVANGAVYTIESQRLAGDPFPFRQPDQLFWNDGGKRFEQTREPFASAVGRVEPQAGRGVTSGDRLRIGFRMLIVFNDGGPAHTVDGLQAAAGGWVGIDTRSAAARPAIGARVKVAMEDGTERHRRVHRDGSYCSSRDPGVLAGLGQGQLASVGVYWPGGGETRLLSPPSERYLVMIERP